MSRTLTDDDVRAVAAEVLRVMLPAFREVVTEPPKRKWLTAQQVADQLEVSLDWVYGHKPELGARPLSSTGEAKRPRWRFHPDRVDDMKVTREQEEGAPQESRHTSRSHRLSGYTSSGAPLLPIRDDL